MFKSEIHQSASVGGPNIQGISLDGKEHYYLLYKAESDVAQVAFYALVMGLAGLIFYYIGVSMGWLYVSLS